VSSPFPTVSLFGVPLADTDYDIACREVNRALREKALLVADTANTMVLAHGCLDSRFHQALLRYDAVIPDSTPLFWTVRCKGARMSDRVYGPYFAAKVLESLEQPTRVALIGGTPRVHEELRRQAPSRFPKAELALLYDAPYEPVDEAYVDRCLREIDRANAQLVFVCLGVPRQYFWAELARPKLGGRVCLTVGGAFDLMLGIIPIAPRWMQKLGLTWLYRLLQEPGRLWRRYLKYNSLYLWFLLTKEVLTGKLFSERKGPS
jgi:N-acetylglucosaminyldiphosphoundecaprenol N-acetyl-beta-D-mannosaminyltransferase